MVRVWRACWVWWLLLALPLQGWAAAARTHCEPGHAFGPAAVSAQGHHDTSAHHHDEGAATHPDHAAVASDATNDAQGCSACAVCCVALAPATTLDLTVEPPPPVRGVRSRAAHSPLFLTSGPERPPRSARP